MNAGVAQIDITPAIGTEMTGFIAREGPSTGALDPLFARALVLDDGEQQAAIITCDLLGLHLSFVNEVRAAIQARTGIPAGHVMITCSHTHAGPATLVLQDCGEIDPGYMAQLHNFLLTVTQTACENQQPVQLTVGHGQVTDHVHNRRTPGDVIDPDLGILQLCDLAGKPLAIVLNYACHPTCLQSSNQLLSAEYPGIAVAKVAAATSAITFFITGAIGDVGPVERGMESMQAIGEEIGNEALRVLAEEQFRSETVAKQGAAHRQPAKLSVNRETITLPLLPVPAADWWGAELQRWQEMAASPDVPLLPSHPKIPVAMRHWASHMHDLALQGTLASQVTSELQIIGVGDLAFVSAPGELFVELGLAIKAALAPNHIFLCGFGNDDIGYIPTRRAYPKGGYEIAEAYKFYRYPTALAAEAGEQIVASAIRLFGHG